MSKYILARINTKCNARCGQCRMQKGSKVSKHHFWSSCGTVADVMTLYVFVLLKVFRLSRFLLRKFF